MKKIGTKLRDSELQTSLADFLTSYNKNMPENFPRASVKLLEEFSAAHASLFSHGPSWSLDRHRKKFMDWLPRRHYD